MSERRDPNYKPQKTHPSGNDGRLHPHLKGRYWPSRKWTKPTRKLRPKPEEKPDE